MRLPTEEEIERYWARELQSVEVTADIPLEPSCCNSSSDTDSACGRGGGEERHGALDCVEGDDEAMPFPQKRPIPTWHAAEEE